MKIVAIGGGEIGRLETLAIDRRIVSLSKNKRALFIPTASGNSQDYCETFKRVYGDILKCKVDFLILPKDTRRARRKILSSGVIYVGGGNTLKMLKVWRKTGVDRLLREAGRRGAVLCGLSAGAICWFSYGISDSRKYMRNPSNKPMQVRGLGIFPGIANPHCVREREWRRSAARRVSKKSSLPIFCIDDCAAIEIDNSAVRVISSRRGRKVRVLVRAFA